MFSFKNFSFPSSQSPVPERPMVIQQTPALTSYPPVSIYQNENSMENDNNVVGDGVEQSLEQLQSCWHFPQPNVQEGTSSSLLLEKLTQPKVEKQEKWSNTFHMRPLILSNFPAGQATFRTTHRSQSVAMHRAKMGYFTSTVKSLDLLRQNLQKHINKEFDEIIHKYLEKFFKPGIENIRRNNGDNSVSDEHVHNVCRQMLEEAKKMYSTTLTRGSTPIGEYSDSETGSQTDMKPVRACRRSPMTKKRKESDTDSEASQVYVPGRPGRKRKRGGYAGGLSGRSTPSKQGPIKREGPKWNPERLTKDTLFILGVRANKALGFGQTRGRLYMKHPEMYKYCCDSDDKQWLHDNNLMPASGGRAYFLILEDVKELADSDDYKYSPGLLLHELHGFTVREATLEKMRYCMNKMRTDLPGRKHRGRMPNVPTCSLPEQSFDLKTDPMALMPDFLNTSPGSSSSALKRTDLESSIPGSPMDDLDLHEPSPNNPSPFLLPIALDDVSPGNANVSPSDLTATLDSGEDPPLSAPFDITASP